VDDELQQLERAHQQDPADIGLARRLKALLLRSGKREEVQLRYKLGFVCKVSWDSMGHTPDPQVRHCATCKKDVHTATTYAEFEAHAAKGHCVSVEPKRLPLVLDGLIDAPELGLTRAPKDPCLVEGAPIRPSPIGPPPNPIRLGGAPMPMRDPRLPPRPITPGDPLGGGGPPKVEPLPEKKGWMQKLLGLFGA
jgi:hypothetical protein